MYLRTIPPLRLSHRSDLFLQIFQAIFCELVSSPSCVLPIRPGFSFHLVGTNHEAALFARNQSVAFLGCSVSMLHHHLHGLGHAWSAPSSWRICWPLHLNCGRPIYRLLFELYVTIFVGIRLFSIRRTGYFHCDLDFRILLFSLKMFISSLILIFIICSFHM
jgi:hypothetical protein